MRILGTETFDTGCMPREQALKVLEEAAELVEAVKDFERHYDPDLLYLAECEAADVIQAVLNLFDMIGFDEFDVERAMSECMERNKARGRYGRSGRV